MTTSYSNPESWESSARRQAELTRLAGGSLHGSEEDDEPLETVLGGGYRIIRVVGEGLHSSVYEGRRALAGRVALKIGRRTNAERRELCESFASGYLLASGLEHPGIIEVFDYQCDRERRGRQVLIMQFISGGDVGALARREGGTLAPLDVAGIAGDVANTLAALHAAGILHLNVAPSHILIGMTGRTVLTGFGRAVPRGGLTRQHQGQSQGTPVLMSPEERRGDRPSDASDVYLLGVTMLQLLTGRSTPDGLSAVAPALVPIIDRALRASPQERWPRMAVMRDAIEEARLALVRAGL